MRASVRGAAPSDIVEIVKLGVFVVFGSLLTLDGLFADGWAAVGDRRLHAAGRAAGGDLDRAGRHRHAGRLKAFMAWFGPKGVATMTFSLLVLSRGHRRAASGSSTSPRSCVFVSILAHGLTDTPGPSGCG